MPTLRWRNGDTDRLSDLLTVTPLISGRARIQAQGVQLCNPCFNKTFHCKSIPLEKLQNPYNQLPFCKTRKPTSFYYYQSSRSVIRNTRTLPHAMISLQQHPRKRRLHSQVRGYGLAL